MVQRMAACGHRPSLGRFLDRAVTVGRGPLSANRPVLTHATPSEVLVDFRCPTLARTQNASASLARRIRPMWVLLPGWRVHPCADPQARTWPRSMASSTSATHSVRMCTIFPCKGSRPQSPGKAPGCRKGLARQLRAVQVRVRRIRVVPVRVGQDKGLAHTRRSRSSLMQQLFLPTSSLFHLLLSRSPPARPRITRQAFIADRVAATTSARVITAGRPPYRRRLQERAESASTAATITGERSAQSESAAGPESDTLAVASGVVFDLVAPFSAPACSRPGATGGKILARQPYGAGHLPSVTFTSGCSMHRLARGVPRSRRWRSSSCAPWRGRPRGGSDR